MVLPSWQLRLLLRYLSFLADNIRSRGTRLSGIGQACRGPHPSRAFITWPPAGQSNRLALDVSGPAYQRRHILSLSPFRSVVRDYAMICESYYQAIRNATPQKIETLDMGRRALHNEGSALLQARLAGKVETDTDTARRLFTLICALHWRG